MSILSSHLAMWIGGLIASILGVVGAVFALPVLAKAMRRAGWWLLAALGFALLVVGPVLLPRPGALDPRLPSLFLDYYPASLLALGLGSYVALALLVRWLVVARRSAVTDAAAGEAAGRFPELEAAWAEIQLRLGQAQIDLAGQHVYLLIAPDEDAAGALVRSAGLRTFAEAPDGPAPIHAYATPEGVLLSCGGASMLGAQDPGGVARMEALCRLLLALDPECPVVRGVAVLFPIHWDAHADAPKKAAAVRDDLQAIGRMLKVRCPVFALFTEMEAVPGFAEFVGRMSAPMLGQRVGFAVPSTQEFSGDLVNRGLIWMSGWFQAWILNLISGDLLNDRGNGRLARLDHEARRRRKRFRSILESAFTTPPDSEPVFFRGCYFVATGDRPHEQAFSAGLFRGPRSRVIADHLATHWSRGAELEDRRYYRLAWAVGVVGGLLILATWIWMMVVRDALWSIGLIAVVIAWVIAILRLSNR